MKFSYGMFTCTIVCLMAMFAVDAQAQFGRKSQQVQQTQTVARPNRNATPELDERAGPWLIMCASFVGEDAEAQSQNLIRELAQYGLSAYQYRHRFDYSESIRGLGFDSNNGQQLSDGRVVAKPKKMRANNDAVFDEIAVLVGDFPTLEDARAQQTLDAIKHMMPEALGKIIQADVDGDIYYVPPENANTQRFRVLRGLTKSSNQNANKKKGPMGAAFLMTNPLLPDEFFNAYHVDEFVLNLNKNVKHSLLENPGRYSVRVATFRGDSTFELDQMQQQKQEQTWKLKNGKTIHESKLALASARANRLTVELRKMGIAAYEFHDRHESYVCIGEFDWLKSQGRGNEEQQNPRIVEAIEIFKGQIENFPGVQGAVRPQTLSDIARSLGIDKKVPEIQKLGIVFDVQPVPVQVPMAQLVFEVNVKIVFRFHRASHLSATLFYGCVNSQQTNVFDECHVDRHNVQWKSCLSEKCYGQTEN